MSVILRLSMVYSYILPFHWHDFLRALRLVRLCIQVLISVSWFTVQFCLFASIHRFHFSFQKVGSVPEHSDVTCIFRCSFLTVFLVFVLFCVLGLFWKDRRDSRDSRDSEKVSLRQSSSSNTNLKLKNAILMNMNFCCAVLSQLPLNIEAYVIPSFEPIAVPFVWMYSLVHWIWKDVHGYLCQWLQFA